MQRPPLPPIDRSELRPGRWWYGIAGITAVIGILIGVYGGFDLFARSAIPTDPVSHHALSDTGTGEVRLAAGQEWAVFSTADSSWKLECTARSGKYSASMTYPAVETAGTGNGRGWYVKVWVTPPADGTYRFRCGPLEEDDFGNVGRLFAGQVAGYYTIYGRVAVLALLSISMITSVIISIVTRVKRRSHERLIAERYGPAQGPPPRDRAPDPT